MAKFDIYYNSDESDVIDILQRMHLILTIHEERITRLEGRIKQLESDSGALL